MRRPQLSYANVISSIALFVALGGTSYAVARNSIGTAQLKNNAVTSAKIKNGAVRSGDLAPSARVGQRGPRGPQGPSGGTAAGGGLKPDAWQPMPYIGGWGDVTNPGYQPGGFRKDSEGLVHLRGLMDQHNGLPSQSPIIAVLPVGYRPSNREIFSTLGGAPDGTIRVDVLPDGSVLWNGGPNAESDFVTLAGLTFATD
jgi:hypothetical protein